MINRGLATRAAEAAQNKDKQKNSRHLHDCGLSILAIRRPSSYLIEIGMATKLFLSGPSWPEQPESLPGKAECNGDNKPDYVLYNSLTFRLQVIAFAWQCSHEQIAWPVIASKKQPSGEVLGDRR